MFNISVVRNPNCIFDIEQMSVKRDWMDVTDEKHAYRCFPVTQANVIGWSLSCSKDIVFTWDGKNDQTPDHIQISSPLPGYAGRGQSSISFDTGLTFRSDTDVSLWVINPVNFFNDNFETMSSVMSTSFYNNPLPLAIKARKANVETKIVAGTPIATIVPISLTYLNHSTINFVKHSDPQNLRHLARESYGEAAQRVNKSGKFTDWYRDAVNEKNEIIGNHEVKVLRLCVYDTTKPKPDISSWHIQGE